MLQVLLKEMRVRFGILLKTDNISFLVGAGASIGAGGVSLVAIPQSLEKALLDKACEERNRKKLPAWITLFYKTLSVLSGKPIACDKRQQVFQENEDKDIPPIKVNLENYLSHLHMWLAGMGDSADSKKNSQKNGFALQLERTELEMLIKEITQALSVILNLPSSGYESQLVIHRKFIKKILTRPLNLRRVNIFTLNYDTLIEQATDAEGAVLVDGFIGTLRRVFRPESYDLDFYFPAQTTEGRVHRFDRALHLYKLHGSLTWHKTDQGWENPYGLYATFFNQEHPEDDVLIYPSHLKYGQALDLPYSELFRRFGNAIAQPQSVLFTIGYGFGDEHVNALIRQALAIPSFTLIIVDPAPQNSFVGQLKTLEDERVWIITGWKLGTFKHFVYKLLPDLHEEEIDAKVMKTYRALIDTSPKDKSHEESLYYGE
jgi:hypothetical protein